MYIFSGIEQKLNNAKETQKKIDRSSFCMQKMYLHNFESVIYIK